MSITVIMLRSVIFSIRPFSDWGDQSEGSWVRGW